jgi:hypothetical protein
MLLKDLTFDDQGTSGVPMPDGNWLDIIVKIAEDNPAETRFYFIVISPPTAWKPTMGIQDWNNLHPLEAQTLLNHLTTKGLEHAVHQD